MQNRKKLCVALCILLLGICACHTGNFGSMFKTERAFTGEQECLAHPFFYFYFCIC